MKPYIICYMMTSVDWLIDCGMTSSVKRCRRILSDLGELDIPTTLSGRTTAESEMALPGKFEASVDTPYGKECFSKKWTLRGMKWSLTQ